MLIPLNKPPTIFSRLSLRYLSTKNESELLKTFSHSKSKKSSRQRSSRPNNNNNNENIRDLSAVTHLKRSIISKEAINYPKLKYFKQYTANLESSFCKRFQEQPNVELILDELISLTSNGIHISRIPQDVIDRLDTFINLENLYNSGHLSKLLSGEADSSKNSHFAFNFQLISKYPLNLQKLILFNIYVPLFDSERIIKIQNSLSRKLSSDEFFALITSVKLYNGEMTLNDLSSSEREFVFSNIDSINFKNKLILNHFSNNMNSFSLQELMSLMNCYSNCEDLFKLEHGTPFFEVKLPFNLPKQLLLKYLQKLKQNKNEKEYKLLLQKLGSLSTAYNDVFTKIDKDKTSLEYSINNQFNDQKIHLATAIKYYSNNFTLLIYFLKSSISRCQGYKIINGDIFQNWITKLSDDEKSIVFNNLLRSSVITNYTGILDWLKYRSKHQLFIELVIYAGTKNSAWAERVFLTYDYHLISNICNSSFVDLEYINQIKKQAIQYPDIVNMLDLPASYDGQLYDDAEELYVSILKQNKELKYSNKEDNEVIFKLMIETHKNPKKVMNLISKMYPSTKRIIGDLIDDELDDDLLKYSIYQRPLNKPLSIFNIIIKFWEHDDGYNIEKMIKRYPEILKSLTKPEIDKLLKNSIANNNYLVLGVLNKIQQLDNTLEFPHLNISLISKIKTQSPLTYQRQLFKLSKLKSTKITKDQYEALFKELPEKYHLILLKYSTQLFKKIPFSNLLYSKILSYYWINSKNCNQITSMIGIATTNDEKLKYNESLALKWDIPYLFIGLMFLLNKNNARLDQWTSILNKAIMLPKNTLDLDGFEILNCVNKLNKFDINSIKFNRGDHELNFNEMLKLTKPMGLLFKSPFYLQNLTISFLVRVSYLMAISPEFPENIRIKDLLSFWYVLLNSNNQKEEYLNNIGFWDLLSLEDRSQLLRCTKDKLRTFDINKDLFNYHDLNMLFRMLFYISKYRNLANEELQYFVNLSKNIMNDSKLSLKEKSFPMYVGYVLVSKNSSILFRYHNDIIKSDSNFKVFKSIIPSVLEATINTKVSDLDLVLDQMIKTYKSNRIEIDEEVNKLLKHLVLNDKNDLAQDLFLTYNKKCKYPKFKSDIGRSMGWKSFNDETRYQIGEINTKVDGRNVKLFDKMLDEL